MSKSKWLEEREVALAAPYKDAMHRWRQHVQLMRPFGLPSSFSSASSVAATTSIPATTATVSATAAPKVASAQPMAAVATTPASSPSSAANSSTEAFPPDFLAKPLSSAPLHRAPTTSDTCQAHPASSSSSSSSSPLSSSSSSSSSSLSWTSAPSIAISPAATTAAAASAASSASRPTSISSFSQRCASIIASHEARWAQKQQPQPKRVICVGPRLVVRAAAAAAATAAQPRVAPAVAGAVTAQPRVVPAVAVAVAGAASSSTGASETLARVPLHSSIAGSPSTMLPSASSSFLPLSAPPPPPQKNSAPVPSAPVPRAASVGRPAPLPPPLQSMVQLALRRHAQALARASQQQPACASQQQVSRSISMSSPSSVKYTRISVVTNAYRRCAKLYCEHAHLFDQDRATIGTCHDFGLRCSFELALVAPPDSSTIGLSARTPFASSSSRSYMPYIWPYTSASVSSPSVPAYSSSASLSSSFSSSASSSSASSSSSSSSSSSCSPTSSWPASSSSACTSGPTNSNASVKRSLPSSSVTVQQHKRARSTPESEVESRAAIPSLKLVPSSKSMGTTVAPANEKPVAVPRSSVVAARRQKVQEASSGDDSEATDGNDDGDESDDDQMAKAATVLARARAALKASKRVVWKPTPSNRASRLSVEPRYVFGVQPAVPFTFGAAAGALSSSSSSSSSSSTVLSATEQPTAATPFRVYYDAEADRVFVCVVEIMLCRSNGVKGLTTAVAKVPDEDRRYVRLREWNGCDRNCSCGPSAYCAPYKLYKRYWKRRQEAIYITVERANALLNSSSKNSKKQWSAAIAALTDFLPKAAVLVRARAKEIARARGCSSTPDREPIGLIMCA